MKEDTQRQESLLCVVANRHKYTREKSLPLLCVPACLNMILTRRGYQSIPQLELANGLHLVVPTKLKVQFPSAEVSENAVDWGANPNKVEADICAILSENKINIKHIFLRWQEVSRDVHLIFMETQIALGNDVAVGFRASEVYDGTQPVGHVALISAVDQNLETVTLMDPETGTDSGIVVPWARLFVGMVAARDGYWIFGEHIDSKNLLKI